MPVVFGEIKISFWVCFRSHPVRSGETLENDSKSTETGSKHNTKHKINLLQYQERLQSKEEMESEFVEVSKDMKGHVIGRGGSMLREIMQKSGATVSSRSTLFEEGFTVRGDKEQRACARRLILEIVEEINQRMYDESLPGELVEVPRKYKGLVLGKRGRTLKNISTQTGAKVILRDEEVYIVSGTEEQRQQATLHIKTIIAGGRLRGVQNEFNKVVCYIDGWNLPEDCELKLEQVERENRMVLPGSDVQYRLKPAEDYGPQESCSQSNAPRYLTKLMDDALGCLREIKLQMKTKESLRADMWCHFGAAIIRGPDEEEADKGQWSIEDAAKKFLSSLGRNFWKISFKEGVNLDERILEGNACERTPEEYADYEARYDLAFLTPCGHQIRIKVWVIKKSVGKKLEDIPTPFSDVKNILDEIHFKDDLTRSRCRGWLVLPSRIYLQGDILFPGCEFDCRLTIRGRTDSALVTDYVPREEVRNVLTNYLSELTLRDGDAFGLCLPEGNIPEGFHLTQKRCSKRSVYENDPGFSIIISKESSWRSVVTTEESRVSTDFHLHCKEWDELLNSGDWEPEIIVERLPAFFRFVKKVQGLVARELKETELPKTIPPEILARGPAALEAYKKALAHGKTSVKRVPIMLIGQDRAGKTSLKKSLKGICFDPEEESTVGIEVDPSLFKVSRETWKTGATDNDQTSETAISFDYHTARLIVDSLKEGSKSTLLETSKEERVSIFDSEITEMPRKPTPVESVSDEEHIQTSRESALTLSRDVTHVLPDSTERNQEDVNLYTPHVPNEVAAVAETLLQSDWKDNSEDIYSTLWDFAGQSVYYVTHPLFLTARAIYCLVYDLSLNPNDKATPLVKQGVYEFVQESFNLKTNLDYLDFWMMSVASLASNQNEYFDAGPKSEALPEKLPPVFLVCTHADKPDGGGNPKELSRKLFGRLKRKPYGAQLFDVFFVDNTSLSVHKSECPEVLRLREEVLAVAKELPHIHEEIPIKWLRFEKALQAAKEKGQTWISLKTAKDIASEFCNIDDGKELETMMNYLHDLRCLIHFDDPPELNELVVLDPQWLIDVFKKVITVKPYDSREKKFLKLWCKLEEEGILDEKLLAHAWGPLFNSKETSESLLGIMEKFSLLCPWPSDASSSNSYLVPSMLKSHPPKEIIELVASAKIPSLFIKFENGQVPPGLFARLVLRFFQWGQGKLWRPENPQLFHNFARFFTTEDDYSVILLCHTSSIEVVVHNGNLNLELADDLSKMNLTPSHDSAGCSCAFAVRKQLGSMLECMRDEFCWLRIMRYEMCVICPVCCQGNRVGFCRTHRVQGCNEEQCLHFLSEAELCSDKHSIICSKSASAQNIRVEVMLFEPWFVLQGQKLAVGERDGRYLPPGEGNEENVLALPDSVQESLLSKSCDSKEIVVQLKGSLQLDQASLEQPSPETKRWIRCLASKARCLNRRDVVEHLREITPAGTTGPLLSEGRDVRGIPQGLARSLTIALSGGDEWKVVAEELGLNAEEIRYLDKRTLNPAEAFLGYIANRCRLTVGNLYDVLCHCGLPVVADKL